MWDYDAYECKDKTPSPTLAPATTGPTLEDECPGLGKYDCKYTDGCKWDKKMKECYKYVYGTSSSGSGSGSSDVSASNVKVTSEVVGMSKTTSSAPGQVVTAQVSALLVMSMVLLK